MNRTLAIALACGAALPLALAACTAAPAPRPDQSAAASPEAAPSDHGSVAGATEVAEPQLQLLTVTAAGDVGLLDLLDGGERTIHPVPGPARLTTDGRYAFSDSGSGVSIIDSGAWTWDHGDHFHYYRADPANLGSVDGKGPAAVTGDVLSTAGSTGVFFAGSGEAVLLDNAELSSGRVVERFRVRETPHVGIAAPFGEGALVSHFDEASGETQLRVLDSGGTPTGTATTCDSPQSATSTRAGLVVLCEGGAVVAAAGDLEFVSLPPDAGGSPASLSGRKGRPVLAGPGTDAAGQPGTWSFDARALTWTWSPASAPLLRVSAVGDDERHVVALDTEGRVHVSRGGKETAVTPPLLDPADLESGASSAVTLSVDQQRAYLNAPTAGIVYEIDYADSARVARELTPAARPDFVAEVGL